MEKRKKVEVLAPAGSFESMKAAVNAGADAVYMGGSRFGARAYADNPEQDMLLSAIDYVHFHGRKIYLTVNTLLKEQELEWELYEFLLPYYKAGIDALIIQDMGVIRAVREWFPDLPVHASTQMTITGVNGALEAKRLGASRIVTARELSAEEIKKIHEQVDIEIETFVHGALCYCYSGQCLYSSLIGGRSGNRGRCAQPCRLPYDVLDGKAKRTRPEERYVMNLKDLCGLDSLPDLLESGVDSLKIEGRMKSPRYTAGVVSIYRKYVDLFESRGRNGYLVKKEDKDFLLELFDRGGFSDGYFHDHNGKHMVALREKPAFREVSREVIEKIDVQYIETEIKEKIKGNLTVSKGLPAILILSWKNRSVKVSGDTVLPAKSHPLTEKDIKKQIGKMGGTPFVLEKLDVTLEENTFLPVKSLNELRRNAVEALQTEILKDYRRNAGIILREENRDRKTKKLPTARPGLSVLVEEAEQFEAAITERAVGRIYLSLEKIPWEKIILYAKMCKSSGKEFYLAFPKIYRSQTEKELILHEESWHIPEIDGFLIRVIDELPFVERLGDRYSYVADHSLYTFNREARQVIKQSGFSMDTAPLELNERELKSRGCKESEIVAYGRLPMMVSAQCIRRTTGKCDKKPDMLFMSDRKKKLFPVKNYCRFCYNMIYNSEPLWLADEMEALLSLQPAALRLQFTTERPEEISRVIRAYASALTGKDPGYQPAARTKGHFRRGVE